MHYRLVFGAALARLLQSALASNYDLVENYQGSNFFEKMDFFTGSDPTDGYVTYVDQGTAQNAGMTSLSGNTVYMGVDHTNIASGSGRQSIRVVSQRAYTHMLVTIDIQHMPGSICGVWPAFWTLGGNWPYNGEIDIIEGVNSQNVNYMTLHTSSDCAITGPGNGLLQPYSENCDANVNGNAGCSFHETNTLSYGSQLNSNNGAQVAMEWTSQGISIWWWNQYNPPPGDVFSGNPNPSQWGPPSANFAGSGCAWDSHFSQHQLVFDTTFCGDWAGAVFGSDSQCSNKGSCQSWVQNNPSAFSEAYWAIRDLKVYQNNGQDNDRRDVDNATAAAEAEAHAAEEMLRKPVSVNDQIKRGTDSAAAANAAHIHEAKEMERHARRAAASQVAPSSVAPESRTVDPVKASESATLKEKRAAASQVAPSSVAPESRTVDSSQAIASASAEAVQINIAKSQPTQRDVMAESRRRRYIKV